MAFKKVLVPISRSVVNKIQNIKHIRYHLEALTVYKDSTPFEVKAMVRVWNGRIWLGLRTRRDLLCII